MKRIVLVGLGLIGGSIALALRKRLPEVEIVGVDSQRILQSEICRNLLTLAIPSENSFEPASVALDADLVVLATPVREIIRQLEGWLAAGIAVTDCGSTKVQIVECASRSSNRHWFLPGHPMAGRERGGIESADPELFIGRRWIVCPKSTSSKVCSVCQGLVEELGGIWTEMTPEDHDAAVAFTSHLPQVVASWLSARAGQATASAAGPAFSDMTRVAGGSEAMWRDIFMTNAGSIAQALEQLAGEFGAFANDLKQRPPRLEPLLALLAEARSKKGT